MMLRTLVCLFALSTLVVAEESPMNAKSYPFMNPGLSSEARTADLVGRMTLGEKVGQMQNSAPPIERLGVPAYDWWNECLHGVARAGTATVFPQAIGTAASWDTDLMREVSTAISDEARAKHHEFVRRDVRKIYTGLTFWSPNINIFRDPRWGRGHETYGEDPWLTSRMGVTFVRGLQGDDPEHLKLVATPKHYAVHSGLERERHIFDAEVSDYDLWMTYLPAFEATVREAQAESVMGAYNRVNGAPACANERLLKEILRDRWGFGGYIVSDCGAIDYIWRYHKYTPDAPGASAAAVHAGCDLNCGQAYAALVEAVSRGLVPESEIDTAVTRLFSARFRLGMFDPPETVEYARIPYSVVCSSEHRALARRAAAESIVLLKNDGILPLSRDMKVAVVGPNANDPRVLVGNYSGTPVDPVTPWMGLRDRFTEYASFAPGCERERVSGLEVISSNALRLPNVESSMSGLRGEYFANMNLQGAPAHVRNDAEVKFAWSGAPAPGVPADRFSVRWSGSLVAPKSGAYQLGATTDDGVRLILDGKKILEDWTDHAPRSASVEVELEAGKAYELVMEYYDNGAGAVARLEWSLPDTEPFVDALAAAKEADVVVAVMGISTDQEDEGRDRTEIELPDVQEAMLRALHATGKPVVLVLLSGGALAIPWAKENLPAIVEAWYPGEEGGNAIADVLLGEVNPGGRLPITFYASTEELPPVRDYAMAGRTYRYMEKEPLWPFGWGLSYTSFKYSNLKVKATARAGEPVHVSVDVENTGSRAGDEVVQVYLGRHGNSALRQLVGFERVTLRPGERKTVQCEIRPRQLAVIDANERWVVSPGEVPVYAGSHSPFPIGDNADLLQARFTLTGEPATLED